MKKQSTGTATAKATKEPTAHDVAKFDELRDLGFRTVNLDSGWAAHEMLGDNRIGPYPTHNELITAVKDHVQQTGVDGGNGHVDPDETKIDGITEMLDDIEAAAGSDDEAFDEIERVIGDANGVDIAIDEDELDDAPRVSPTIEITEEDSGQIRLPGQARVINQELTDAALKYHSIKLERVRLSGQETAARDELKVASAKHADMFTPDPDNSNSKIYVAGQTASGKDIVVRDQKVYDEKITTEEVESTPVKKGKKK